MVQHPIVFMFSGQGSQYHGMGGELFKKNETFTECMERLDEVCMRSLGRSIIEVLYSPGKSGAETFNDLRLTSPAIFMVEYSLACSLLANRVYPSYVLGSSLGMFAAAAIAGCLTPEEAMRIIIAETELIEETCPQGTMIAVLGSTDVIRRNNLLFETCEIAAVNFASGFVISALKSNLGAIVEELTSEGVAFHVFDVSRPFHSRWIDPARHECLALLQTVNFTKPSVPIVCCAHRGTIKDLTPDLLWAVIRGTIQFSATICKLESEGPKHYVDLGPSGSLATVLKYSLRQGSQSQSNFVFSPYGDGHKRFHNLMDELRR